MASILPAAVASRPHEGEFHDERDPAVAAVSELRSILPFDAMQLLHHEPQRAEPQEVLRIGYNPGSAWALQHLFVEQFRPGFTHELSPNDGLPPAISSVREEFVGSRIYRDHLRADGYRDGMSMELFLCGEYVGIAHFSARQPFGFTEESRRAASSVGGLLAALVLSQPTTSPLRAMRQTPLQTEPCAGEAPEWAWFVFRGSRDAAPLGLAPVPEGLKSAAFRAHLEQIRARGLRSARHLWAFADGLSRLEIRSYPEHDELLVGVAPTTPSDYHRLSLQELRVLGLLCMGDDDAAIARRLHLSRRTVESHLLNARRKLGSKNRVEAAVRAITTASYLPDPV